MSSLALWGGGTERRGGLPSPPPQVLAEDPSLGDMLPSGDGLFGQGFSELCEPRKCELCE